MSRTTIKMENVTLRYPRQRVTMGPIGKSLKSLLKIHRHTADYFTALKNITLGIKEGEVLGIIGDNGAGKSTMLRLISGIYQPDEGTVKSSGNISLLAGLGVGFNVNLSGRENIYLYGSILGHSKQIMDTLMESIIDFSGLENFIDQPLRTFSSGMRARLGFSVASAIEPDILLIDEVLGVGDSDFKRKSLERIQQMVDNARTVVIVSHSVDMIKQICNRLVLIQDGQITAVGSPSHVIEAYQNGMESH